MSPGSHAHLAALAIDVVRTSIWLFLLTAILVPLERLFAERPQAVLRRQFVPDLAYYFINSLGTAAVLTALGAMLAEGARRIMPGAILSFSAGLSLWPRVLATLVVGEFGFYWGHRWSHEIPLLWRFHAIHHSAEQVDWLTASRGHPLDILFTRLCGFVLIYTCGLARPDTGGSVTISLLTVFTIFWGFFIHANLRWRLGRLEAVISTPAFHRWHHANDEFRNHNYASTLPIYDRLFGTLHLPKRGNPAVFGADTPVPDGVVGQLLAPLDVAGPRSMAKPG